jgi:small subunit ribosomal protein S17
MAAKTEMVGVVVSDKMNESVVVAVERQVRHAVYGKTERRTSKFLAHNEGNVARAGDRVAIHSSRPLSRRKRWVVTRVLRRSLDATIEAAARGEAEPGGEAGTRTR